MTPDVAKTATIVITTRNRRDELRRALRSCVQQEGSPEILVIDDGSTDGTSEMIQTEFPTVIVKRCESSLGCIVRRNQGAKLATGDVIVSIDDDAEFSHPGVISQTIADFDDPRAAAIAIPYINIRLGPEVHQQPPDKAKTWITNEFCGTAHAIRRDVFQAIGGYRDSFVHQHEESDLCIRLLDSEYYVRLGRAEPVIHYLSTNRSDERMELFGQRNLILFAWHNVPMPSLLWHLPATVINGLRWGYSNRFFGVRCRGTVSGLLALLRHLHHRRPVSRNTYSLFRQLKKSGPMLIQRVTR